MSRKMQAKTRRAMAEASGVDPFEYLMASFCRERKKDEKRALAMALMPYLRPRLRAVEFTGDAGLEITVTIGGEES